MGPREVESLVDIDRTRRLPRRARQGARVHPRRRHLSSQPFAALRSPARRTAVRPLLPSPHAERGTLRRLSGLPGRRRGCASPERFLLVDIEGQVETRPSKVRAGPGADGKRQGSGREPDDCRLASKRPVARLHAWHGPRTESFALERYTTVHHLVSTVVGDLARANALNLLCVAFPGGSVTGAPKVRAMEIIA